MKIPETSLSMHSETAPNKLTAKRIGPVLIPDCSHVLVRAFSSGSKSNTEHIICRILAMPEDRVKRKLDEIMIEFKDRHQNVEDTFTHRYTDICAFVSQEHDISIERKNLIGAYFCHEYSPEAAALMNPSIVVHPDQHYVPKGSIRFIMSLRAVGEGHISSITFREGVIDKDNKIQILPSGKYLSEPTSIPGYLYHKELFGRKLFEAGLHNHFCRRVLSSLPDRFSLPELKRHLEDNRANMTVSDTIADRSVKGILLLAKSNYEVRFDPDIPLSQRILFPSGPTQSNGIEDARFVRFGNDDGSAIYYATYTAYDGKITMPQLLETVDFLCFRFNTLNGPAVQNKGMALFPRKIGGKYVMLSRQDDENILIMYSDNIHFWQTPKIIMSPWRDWEFMKIGTCGSPIETDAGWLVLSHGVGAMRKYCLGAFLLDLEDPSKLIGRLEFPLLSPNESERNGYVPNVVYSCGPMLHKRELIIPYAMSDYATSFATVNLDDCLAAMKCP